MSVSIGIMKLYELLTTNSLGKIMLIIQNLEICDLCKRLRSGCILGGGG